jgi:phage-related protein
MAKGPLPTAGNAAALAAFEKAGSVFSKVTTSLQTIASMSGQPAAAVAAFGGQLGKVAGMFGPWGQAVGSFLSTASGLPQVFRSATESLANYVRAFSPATVQRYERAWADLTASVGRILMPVMDGAIRVVRWLGDSIAGLTPILQPLLRDVMASVGPVLNVVGNALREVVSSASLVYQALRPLLGGLLDILNPVRLLTAGMKLFADVLRMVNVGLAALFGLKLPQFQGASQGLAFAQTGTTDVGGMLRRLREEAYKVGGEGEKKDPNVQQVDLLREIYKVLIDRVANLPKEMAEKFKQAMIDALTSTLPNLIGNIKIGPGGLNFNPQNLVPGGGGMRMPPIIPALPGLGGI